MTTPGYVWAATPAATPPAATWSPASAKPLPGGESRPRCSATFKLGGALKVPGLSGRRCEDRGVRHPCIVVASPSGALGDSLPVDHVGVRGLLPETGHPVRNLATAPNSPRIPVSECLVRTGLVSVGAVGGS